MKQATILLMCFAGTLFSACNLSNDNDLSDNIPAYAYAGGETTIFDATSNAFSTPAPNLSLANFERHLEGDLAFEQVFVTAPASVNPGLGPLFNNNSCVACHVKNGRAEGSLLGTDLSGFLVRLSIPGQNQYGGPLAVPNFGTQLQTRANYGQVSEANFTATEIQEIVNFIDGQSVNLTKPNYQITETYQPLPANLLFSPRVAPAVFGIGLLEAIPQSDIEALADEFDADGDGISGKPNYVWNYNLNTEMLGRFGWKAEQPTAQHQSADAYHQDMGITNSIFPQESCYGQNNCISNNEGQLDIDQNTLDVTTFYFQTLAVPALRNYNDPQVKAGRQLFIDAQCASCHHPKHITGNSEIPALANQTIYPYTDMLLHDMGEGLADNRPAFKANGREWRTPPLWGLGLIPVVNGHTTLLHDGRAKSIEEAILWHGGEAENAKQNYIEMSAEERQSLLSFLHAL